MTASERRMAIIQVLCKRRHELIANLAFEFGVTARTITAIGMEDNKLLLYDDFTCIDEGRFVGVVSPAVIKQLRGCN